ncbi:MAG: hypothetical protein KGO81_08185, partial [Bacteroidota bacterium]|nr:hypothetical protein [Bacteroidota bacterium]
MKAFDLPPIRITSAEGTIKTELVLDEIRKARNILLFMRDEKGEPRFIYSDLGEDEFLTVNILMLRNIELFNFFKTCLKDIEVF